MWLNFLKSAFRHFWRRKSFTVINLFGLSIGMACFVLIALFVRDEWAYDRFQEKAGRIFRISPPDLARTAPLLAPMLKKELPEVEGAVGLMRYFGLVKSENVHFNEERLFFAQPDVLNLFSFDFLSGSPSSALTAPQSLILSESSARKYFGTDEAVGRTLFIRDTIPVQVTGVYRNWPLASHLKMDMVVSFSTWEAMGANVNTWSNNTYYTYVLLAPGIDLPAFQRKLDNFVANVIRVQPNRADYSLEAENILDIHLGSDKAMELEPNASKTTISIFISIGLFILLIAGLNYVNLATAIAASRMKEIGVRKVIGANRRLLIGQFLLESVLIALLSVGVGEMLASLGLPLLNRWAGKAIIPAELYLGFLPVALAGIGLLVGLLAGLYPAVVLSAHRPAAVLKKDRPVQRSRFRRSLVIVQLTLSLVLAIGTMVVWRQLQYMKTNSLGFDQEQVLVVPYNWDAKVQAKYHVLKEEWLTISGIQSITASGDVPGRMATTMSFWAEGMPEGKTDGMQAWYVDDDFIPVYGMELAVGRGFQKDIPSDRQSGYLLNEQAVAALGWTNGEALGKRFSALTDGRVIGVVKDFHYNSLREAIQPLFLAIQPDWCGYISLRLSTRSLSQTIAGMERVWRKLFPDRPFEHFFLEEDFNRQYIAETRLSQVVMLFSGLAFAIAGIGLFGLTVFTVEQRTKEIGIRKILGATVIGIVGLLSKDFLRLVIVAMVLAGPLAWYLLNGWLDNFAYRTQVQWWMIALSGAVALGIAFLSVGIKSISAALANPVESLRNE